MSVSPNKLAFELLCHRHTFVVIDTETCPATDGGPQRVVSVATVAVVAGVPQEGQSTFINPGEPITNTSIHGISDATVASVAAFNTYASTLDLLLAGDDVVLVAHNAHYDLGCLRAEYARLGRDIPEVPVLDTMKLPKQLGHDTGGSATLTAVAKSLGVTHKPRHHALEDATDTAAVLVKLLAKAAASGYTELPLLLEHTGQYTTRSVKRETNRVAVFPEPQPVVPDEHRATHTVLLPTNPSEAAMTAWVSNAVACAKLRCPLGRDRAEAAAAHCDALLPLFLNRLPKLREPGVAGTAVGILTALVEHGLDAGQAGRWWKTNRDTVHGLAACQRRVSCPDCQDRRPCPLDICHQSVVRILLDAPSGEVSQQVTNSLTRVEGSKLGTWVRQGLTDVAGYAAALCVESLADRGNFSRVGAVVDLAHMLGLDEVEPRIALERAKTLALQGRLADAQTTVDVCLRGATTDAGFDDLRDTG